MYRLALPLIYFHTIALLMTTQLQSASMGETQAWSETLLLENPVVAFMVDEPPTVKQLDDARVRTTALIKKLDLFDSEPKTKDKKHFRLGLRARWLQLNLEYQAFLAAAEGANEDAAKATLEEHRKVLAYLWYEPPTEELNGVKTVPIQKNQKFKSLLDSGENELEWQEVKPFLDMVCHDIVKDLPPEPRSAHQVVRAAYFNGIAPSQDGGINKDIRNTVGTAFQDVQNLGKEAVAAKVQAAVVMRRFYGVTPEATRASFVYSPEKPKDEAAKSVRQAVALTIERDSLFPADQTEWESVKSLIRDVSSSGVGGGVVSDYLAINLSLDENGGQTEKRTGYDGLIVEVRESDVVPADGNVPSKVADTVTDYLKLKDQKLFRGVLSRAYGRNDGSRFADKTAEGTTYATLWDLMTVSNSQSEAITQKAKGWANRAQENLDALFAYDLVESDVKATPQPVVGDAFARAAAPENRIERKWFEYLTSPPNKTLGSSLQFVVEESNKLLAASKIPNIQLNPTYSSQIDVLVRELAAAPLLTGSASETSTGTLQNEQNEERQVGSTGPDPTGVDTSKAEDTKKENDSEAATPLPNIAVTAQAKTTSSVPNSSDSSEGSQSEIHKLLLSQQAIKLSDGDQRTTMLELLEDLWDVYLPTRKGQGTNFIGAKTVEWLRSKLKDAHASQLAEHLHSDYNQKQNQQDAQSNNGNTP